MIATSGLDSPWTQISFCLGVSDDVLLAIRTLYQEEWDAAQEAGEDGSANDLGARRAMFAWMRESLGQLFTATMEFLTPEQQADLDEWQRQQAERFQQRRPNRGPGR